MNIKARINARKVALSYLYQHCFFRYLLKQKSTTVESLFIDNIFETQTEKFAKEREDFFEQIRKHRDISPEENIPEIIDGFFDERDKEDIDTDYVMKVVTAGVKLDEEIAKQVNTYANSFTYEEMDTMDQALFLLAYAEKKALDTPKEVIINEMIELAKRYSDEGSPKLLNGILHKICTPPEVLP